MDTTGRRDGEVEVRSIHVKMIRPDSTRGGDESDTALLSRAAAWPSHRDLCELDATTLRDVSRREGIDFATALLYDRVCRSADHDKHKAVVGQFDHQPAAPNCIRDLDVLVVPGAFHAQRRGTGADGQHVLDAARQLGSAATLIDVPGFGSPTENAVRILQALRSRQSSRRLVLVSLSKGSLDVRRAFEHSDGNAALRDVEIWISISGLATGSPLVGWLRRRPWRLLGLRMLFAWHGLPYSVLDEIDRDAVSRSACSLQFADSTDTSKPQIVHVVGFPLRRHLSCPLAQRGHRRLAPLGPNDGTVLLADVCRLPGVVYPVWAADHYLKLPAANVGKIFGHVLSRVFDAISPPLAGRTS